MLRAINRRFTLEIDAGKAQLFCYGLALLIMVVGIRKVASLDLTEANLIFGILLVLILTLQVIIAGTVVGLYGKARA